MFNLFTDSIDNALSVAGDILEMEPPDRREVAQLLNDGLTVGAIAAGFGVAIEVIEALIDE